MKVIYVAGRFRAPGKHGQPDQWGQKLNIDRAAAISLKLWQTGLMAPICPHLNTAPFQGAAADEIWLRGDLALVERCDAMVLTPDWRKSEGARGEKEYAEKIGLPIFEWDDDVNDAYSLKVGSGPLWLMEWARDVISVGSN